jgi:glycosyltransferase involved in cell wall biosynthesis
MKTSSAVASPLRVLLAGTSYPRDSSDWRGVFIRNMLASLSSREDLDVTYWGPPGELPPHVHDGSTSEDRAWLGSLMERGGIAHILRQGGWRGKLAPFQLIRHLRHAYQRNVATDVYHVNWLQTALPLPAGSTPLLVTVLGTDFALLKKPLMAAMLRRVFSRRQTLIAPNAEWMVPPLQQYFGDIARIQHIPFGIDASWYEIARRYDAEQPRKWLLVSRLTRRKIGPLFDWGADIFGGANELHILGPMQEEVTIPSWAHYHGSTFPQNLRSNWFPGAAGLVSLSTHDEGRPQVMLEAMAAAIPIIASPLPAHSGIVSHAGSGWLAPDRAAFKAGIEWLGAAQNNQLAGTRSREWATENVGTWTDCADRYVKAYRILLDQ